MLKQKENLAKLMLLFLPFWFGSVILKANRVINGTSQLVKYQFAAIKTMQLLAAIHLCKTKGTQCFCPYQHVSFSQDRWCILHATETGTFSFNRFTFPKTLESSLGFKMSRFQLVKNLRSQEEHNKVHQEYLQISKETMYQAEEQWSQLPSTVMEVAVCTNAGPDCLLTQTSLSQPNSTFVPATKSMSHSWYKPFYTVYCFHFSYTGSLPP